MNKIFTLTIVTILITSSGIMAFAQPEPYHKVRHYGFSTTDRADTLDFTFYNNIISGILVFDGQTINFTAPVKLFENNFILKDIKNNLLILGSDLSKQNNVKVRLPNTNVTEFKMYMPKEPITQSIPKTPTYFKISDNDNAENISNILERYENWKDKANTIKQPIANYSNVIIDPETITGITIEPDTIYSASIDEIYEFNLSIQNVTNNDVIPNTNVTIVYSRDGHEMYTQNYVSDNTGNVNVQVATINPVFYPGQCVDVTISAQHEKYTATLEDDFVILDIASFSYLESLDMSWIYEEYWSHLPEEFKLTERETDDYDDECNT